jgi:predicted nucleotidyltransferase
MRDLNQIKAVLASHKNELFERFRIENMAIFGSYARNEQNGKSDVDILVEFHSSVGVEFIDLANYLESVLEVNVDLVSRKGLKTKYYDEIKGDLVYV